MNRAGISIVALTTLLFLGCDKTSKAPSDAAPPSREAPSEVSTKSASVAEKLKAEREAFIVRSKQELTEVKTQITELRTKANKLLADAKTSAVADIEKLEEELKRLDARLTELRVASAEKWEAMKEDFRVKLESLRDRVRKSGS